VKCAAPGVTSTAVQRAGQTFASDLNWQWRLEIPDNITTDEAAEAHVNSTLGRNDFSVVAFPSFGYVLDPDKPGLQKLVPLTGMIHGVEARFAADYEGYHKAVAGLAAVLPRVVRLPTGDRVLNEELLNPNGLQAIKKKAGNFVIWGDRTVSVDPAWIWKHQREQMSHYEHTLAENFDWAIFEINDPRADFLIRSALLAFFAPEYRKGAIRGTDLEDAALIKVDSEINTDSTRATGDLFAEVSLRLANTVERLTIRMSKQGVTELAKAA
jgi:phage tail sheath protein FI